MRDVMCKLTGERCIHADSQPDEGVYDDCLLCDVYLDFYPDVTTNAKRYKKAVKHALKKPQTHSEVELKHAEWLTGDKVTPRKFVPFWDRHTAFCSNCKRKGRIEWKCCPYCLALMPASSIILHSK